MEAQKHAWFEEWFDSEYYHHLYKSRDENEAHLFLDHVIAFLKPERGSYLLDLACGKGRHARYLNSLGFNVLGVDLSPHSIMYAKAFSNDSLHFRVGDMREPQSDQNFDVVFNLFTSFGYFESAEENLRTLKAVYASLKANGQLVIDFMNSEKAICGLQPHYKLERNGIHFHIDKYIENQIIHKKISFTDKGKSYQFEERVQALTLADFKNYFEQTGFRIAAVFGSYLLEPFDPATSDRMIFVVQKHNQFV